MHPRTSLVYFYFLRVIFFKGMKQFYLYTTKYLIDHMPIENEL